MVDLQGQYQRIQPEMDDAIRRVIHAAEFIQGPAVKQFESSLSHYVGGAHVISCGNGTDALQIAMMALDLQPGDEVIVPVHTYVATAEVIALLRLVPVFAEVHPDTFTLDPKGVETLITPRTRAMVPVHLYGQCANLEPLEKIAKRHGIHIIEDAAQSLGAVYRYSDGRKVHGGTAGIIGTTSFFPSKNLGAFGDGGALFTRDQALADRLRMIANHGQQKKYQHDVIGVNSRLDTLQAAILSVKLNYLDDYAARRQAVADYYDKHLAGVPFLQLPGRASYSSHVFHQYTVRTKGVDRDALKAYLQEKGVPTMIYYPIPLHLQAAYRKPGVSDGAFPITEQLSRTVLSLPVHTEMEEDQLSYICEAIGQFG
jgi:dTDP-4-amino-4,6-dideoxygalactose transaminase